MDSRDLLLDLFDRTSDNVRDVLDGLTPEQLTATVTPGSNSIGWLVWHLTRVQDHHVSELLEQDQQWVSDDWGPRFGLPSDPDNTGYGHGPAEVGSVRPESAAALLEHHRAVESRTLDYVKGLSAADLDAVVDERWDPPVTLGVRLISVADDDAQHVGQAAYLRGLLGC